MNVVSNTDSNRIATAKIRFTQRQPKNQRHGQPQAEVQELGQSQKVVRGWVSSQGCSISMSLDVMNPSDISESGDIDSEPLDFFLQSVGHNVNDGRCPTPW